MADEIELLGLFADFAELSRNRPAGEDLHTELRVHSSKEHFHTYLQSLDVDRGGLPQQFRDRLARVLAHYGVTDWDRTPRAGGGGVPDLPRPAALRPRRTAGDRAPPALDRRAAADGGAGRPGARPPRAPGPVHPAAVPGGRRPGPQHPLPLVRPAAGRRRALQRPGRRPRRGRGARRRSRRSRPDRSGWRRWPRSPSRSCGSSPSGSRPASRSRSRCSRCWCAATTASTTCTACGRSCATGRTFAVADYILDDRPTRLVSTVGTIAELGRPRQRAGHGRRRRGRRPRRRSRGGASTSTCTGPTPRSRRSRPARSSPASSARCPSPTTYAGSRWRSAPARDRPVNYFTYRPARRRRRRRGRPGPRRAPDGRPPARPVAAARLPRHPHRGARGRAPLRVRGAGEPRRPPARRPGPGPPARRRPRRGGQGHRPAPRGAGGGELPRGDPPRPYVARRGREQARHQPRVGPGVARSSRPMSSS